MTENEQIRHGESPSGSPEEHPTGGHPFGGDPVGRAGDDSEGKSPPTIKPKTEVLYRRIVKVLVKHSTRNRSSDPLEPVMVSPTMLVEDLYARKNLPADHPDFLEWSTFSTYRSALLWHLDQNKENPAYETALEKLMEYSSMSGIQARTTPQKKRRVISQTDLHALIEELSDRGHRSKWAYRSVYWLLAGLATGLRPIEWENAAWEDEAHTALVVNNAKIKLAAPAFLRKEQPDEAGATEYKSRVPTTRTIPVLNSKDSFNIETHMNLIRAGLAEGADFTHYYEQCRRAIWLACRKLWGDKKTYSLYTVRGQYSANQRATVGSAKTSVLMGHSRPDSPSAAHYGKANQAHKGFSRRPENSQQVEHLVEAPLQAPAAIPNEP